MHPLLRVAKRAVVTIAAAALCVGVIGCGTEGGDEDALTQALDAHAKGRIEEATELYNDVVERDPSNKFAHYNLGLIDQTEGRADAAERSYRRALKVDPRFVPAMFNLATLLSESDPGEAITHYRRIIRIQPNHASAHLNLGFLLKQQGKEDEGEAELEKAVELDKDLESRIPPSPTPQGPATPAP